MEAPKISFGFSKVKKKPSIIPQNKPVEQRPEVEFITAFVHRDPHAVEEKKALTIPVKDVDGIANRIMACRKRKETPENEESEIKPIAYDKPYGRSMNVIPLKNAEAEESSVNADYDNVPVTEFGLAMLRGMGWEPGKGIGKKQKVVEYREPELRPRGLGLGAGPDAIASKE